MKDAKQEYEAALADFAQPGNRWTAKGALTYWGKAAGLTAEEIIADARASGVADRDADIRRGWNDAKPQGDRPTNRQRFVPRARPKPPPTFPRFVRDMVEAGGTADFDEVQELSPMPILLSGTAQAASFFRWLFDPADVLHVFRDDAPTAGKPGGNLIPCRDWLAKIERGEELPGDLIVPNPFTGEEGETTDGKKSFVAQSCLARFPFMVIEFDGIPLAMQCAFWCGLLTTSPLGPKVAAITFSGGKSLHGLLHVGCRTLTEWQTARDGLKRLLCADPAFRADEQAMHPRTGTRLPGVRRFSNGKMQNLLYLNPDAVRPGSSPLPLAPLPSQDAREAASARSDAQTATCPP